MKRGGRDCDDSADQFRCGAFAQGDQSRSGRVACDGSEDCSFVRVVVQLRTQDAAASEDQALATELDGILVTSTFVAGRPGATSLERVFKFGKARTAAFSSLAIEWFSLKLNQFNIRPYSSCLTEDGGWMPRFEVSERGSSAGSGKAAA